MSEIPSDLKYTQSHEWLRKDQDDTAIVGITDHAQVLLGDIVYVELPELGNELAQGAECTVVESVKAAADVYMPIAGKIIAINEQLSDTPELINKDPYGQGWLFKLKITHKEQLSALLTQSAYSDLARESE